MMTEAYQWKGIFQRVLMLVILLGLLNAGNMVSAVTVATGRKQIISSHAARLERSTTALGGTKAGIRIAGVDYAGSSSSYKLDDIANKGVPNELEGLGFVEVGKEKQKFVGILEHEHIMTYSQNLKLAFMKSSKFTHSLQFLKELFSTNPFLMYFALRYKNRVQLVDALQHAAERWSPFGKDKAVAAEKVMVSYAFKNLYSLVRKFTERTKYNELKQELLRALREANAGGHALDLILGNKTKPIFSWLNSLYANPLATLSNVVRAAFHEAFMESGGLTLGEVKGSCFSFGYRINNILPYTAVLPAVHGDPIASPIMKELLKNNAPAMITLLFQLYAVDVDEITKKGKRVSSALAAGSAGWNYADGLWVGAFDFGRAFMSMIRKYKNGAEVFVEYCKHHVYRNDKVGTSEQSMLEMSEESNISQSRDSNTPDEGRAGDLEGPELLEGFEDFEEPLQGDLKNAFLAIAPGVEATKQEAQTRLGAACLKYEAFVKSYTENPVRHVQLVVQQSIKVLKYDYKFFASYVGEMISIFYETAYALLNADVANVLEEKFPLETMGDQVNRVIARMQKYKEATLESMNSSLPRQMFREPWLRKAGTFLANGFFESAGGLSLYYAMSNLENEELIKHRDDGAFKMLKKGVNSLKNGINSVFSRFLRSRLMIARLEGNASVKTVQDLIAKCNEKLGVPNPEICGKIVTSEVDPIAFLVDALFSLHAPMAAEPDDIALLNKSSITKLGGVFADWLTARKLSRDNREIAERLTDTSGQPVVNIMSTKARNIRRH